MAIGNTVGEIAGKKVVWRCHRRDVDEEEELRVIKRKSREKMNECTITIKC